MWSTLLFLHAPEGYLKPEILAVAIALPLNPAALDFVALERITKRTLPESAKEWRLDALAMAVCLP